MEKEKNNQKMIISLVDNGNGREISKALNNLSRQCYRAQETGKDVEEILEKINALILELEVPEIKEEKLEKEGYRTISFYSAGLDFLEQKFLLCFLNTREIQLSFSIPKAAEEYLQLLGFEKDELLLKTLIVAGQTSKTFYTELWSQLFLEGYEGDLEQFKHEANLKVSDWLCEKTELKEKFRHISIITICKIFKKFVYVKPEDTNNENTSSQLYIIKQHVKEALSNVNNTNSARVEARKFLNDIGMQETSLMVKALEVTCRIYMKKSYVNIC